MKTVKKDSTPSKNKSTKEELHKVIAEKRLALNNFYFGTTGSKATNVKLARTLRKDIARALTALHLLPR